MVFTSLIALKLEVWEFGLSDDICRQAVND